MQHLLDFIHEHTQEEQLYLVVSTPSGELELLWQCRLGRNIWQLRPMHCEGPSQHIAHANVVATLTERNADMVGLECELRSIIMIQIAAAHVVLRDAGALLGEDVVQRAVLAHDAFVYQLTDFVQKLTEPAAARAQPKLSVVAGGGGQSAMRLGHLRVVI